VAVTKKKAAGGDVYDYKKSKKAQQKLPSKKRRVVSPFTESKLKSKEELEMIEEENESEQRGTSSLGQKKMNDIMERFAYTPVLQANKSKLR